MKDRSIVGPLPAQRTASIELRHLITATSLFTGVVFKLIYPCLQGCMIDNGACRRVFVYACLREHSKCGRATTTSGGAGGAGGARPEFKHICARARYFC